MGARVLVVQSREALAHATCRALHDAGLEASVALDGDTAVRLAVTDPPDAVVFDLTLPVLDGWFVIAALGARSPRPQLVAFGSASDAPRAAQLGVDACVCDRARVVPAVTRVLDRVAVA
jgi:DNA-binding response OmpR family regulator